jgi:hypothetical protein
MKTWSLKPIEDFPAAAFPLNEVATPAEFEDAVAQASATKPPAMAAPTKVYLHWQQRNAATAE